MVKTEDYAREAAAIALYESNVRAQQEAIVVAQTADPTYFPPWQCLNHGERQKWRKKAELIIEELE